MNEQAHEVVHKSDSFPTQLKTAAEIAEKMPDVTAERLISLAKAGYAPHYRVDGGEPLFRANEIRGWVGANLVEKNHGRSLADALRIVVPAPRPFEYPPSTISNLRALQQVPVYQFQPSIYFLCRGDDVIYVGQSVSPATRLAVHHGDPTKDFDRVYLLPVPEHELDNVESALIHYLRPEQQGGIRMGRKDPIRPQMVGMTEEEVIQSLGLGT